MQINPNNFNDWLEWCDRALHCSRTAISLKLMGKSPDSVRLLERAARYANRKIEQIERGF